MEIQFGKIFLVVDENSPASVCESDRLPLHSDLMVPFGLKSELVIFKKIILRICKCPIRYNGFYGSFPKNMHVDMIITISSWGTLSSNLCRRFELLSF